MLEADLVATFEKAIQNTDDPGRLTTIVEALSHFARNIKVVLPLHPRTRSTLAKQGKLQALHNAVVVLDPLGYLAMVQLEKYAAIIATDSGGVQKEAFFYGVPCVTLRDETEWTELVDAGWNRLAPPVDANAVLHSLRAGLESTGDDIAPYGAGDAAVRIVECLSDELA